MELRASKRIATRTQRLQTRAQQYTPISTNKPGANAPPRAPADWQTWLKTLLPNQFSVPFASRHVELWEWAWGIHPTTRPKPFVAIWPRAGGKSTNAQAMAVALGARGIRRYVLYVMETQDQADQAVQNIAAMLEGPAFGIYYPDIAARAVGKYGNAKGWRRNRVITRSGFVVDAMGLDTAKRGANVEGQRPDFFILDDIDGLHDSDDTAARKESIVKKSILPMGHGSISSVLFAQNLINPIGLAARLTGHNNMRTDMLADRIISGPHPAIHNLVVHNVPDANGQIRQQLTGAATWEGQSLEDCQRYVDSEGLQAFIEERQHEFPDRLEALLSREVIDRNRIYTRPELEEIVVGVDPPASGGRCGIVVKGRLGGQLYTLEDCSTQRGAGPEVWGQAVVDAYSRWQANAVVAEINQGGQMVAYTIRSIANQPLAIMQVRATTGKRTRAEPIAALHHVGRVHHVGVFVHLEADWCRWLPGMPSPDALDADVWASYYLLRHELGSAQTHDLPLMGWEE